MSTSCRSWWRNCALHSDCEIIAIDKIEDSIAPVDENIFKIRELISSLELCHHKAERWVYNIIEAIGIGETKKGLGTGSSNQQHPSMIVWQNACTALSLWCKDNAKDDLLIGNIPASLLFDSLGERSPLKEWQVQRVIERIHSVINWQHTDNGPATQYHWLLLNPKEHDVSYLNQCPEYFMDHEDSWLTTVRTFIQDTEFGDNAELSLALAIDMLWPCHWNFIGNLQIVLKAIGGNLNPDKPFAACGRNITLVLIHRRMEIVSNTLKAFCGNTEPGIEIDRELVELLGNPTEEKKWLAASLDKTIRLQLDPPAELREISVLPGPEWIKQ